MHDMHKLCFVYAYSFYLNNSSMAYISAIILGILVI